MDNLTEQVVNKKLGCIVMKWLTFSVAIAVLLFCLMTCGLRLSKSKTPGNIDLPKEIVHEKDGSTMVLIPAGEFIMGSTDEEISRWEDDVIKKI